MKFLNTLFFLLLTSAYGMQSMEPAQPALDEFRFQNPVEFEKKLNGYLSALEKEVQRKNFKSAGKHYQEILHSLSFRHGLTTNILRQGNEVFLQGARNPIFYSKAFLYFTKGINELNYLKYCSCYAKRAQQHAQEIFKDNAAAAGIRHSFTSMQREILAELETIRKAYLNLSKMYFSGLGGVPKDFKEAEKHAVEAGSPLPIQQQALDFLNMIRKKHADEVTAEIQRYEESHPSFARNYAQFTPQESAEQRIKHYNESRNELSESTMRSPAPQTMPAQAIAQENPTTQAVDATTIAFDFLKEAESPPTAYDETVPQVDADEIDKLFEALEGNPEKRQRTDGGFS